MRTHCNSGRHEWVEGNITYPKNRSPYCYPCRVERDRSYYKPKARVPATHCAKGHEFTVENTITRPNGTRACRQCRKNRRRVQEQARRAEAKAQIPVDGWEDEFGPCPPARSDWAWVDRVALMRKLRGEPVGRNLTPGETRALHLLQVLQGETRERTIEGWTEHIRFRTAGKLLMKGVKIA